MKHYIDMWASGLNLVHYYGTGPTGRSFIRLCGKWYERFNKKQSWQYLGPHSIMVTDNINGWHTRYMLPQEREMYLPEIMADILTS